MRNLELNSVRDVEEAASLVSWIARPPVGRVAVRLPWLDERERARAARQIRFLFNDCGCFWGVASLLLSIPILIQFLAPSGWLGGAVMVVGALGAAGMGKIVGLVWSRWRLIVLLNGLKVRSSAHDQERSDSHGSL